MPSMPLGSIPRCFSATSELAPQSISSRQCAPLTRKQVLNRPPLPNASPQPMNVTSTIAPSIRLSIRLQDIARAAHRLQEAREFRVGLDLAPESRHLHVHPARRASHLRLERQRLARYRLARSARECQQQRGLGGGEPHRLAAAIELPAPHVETIAAEPQLGGSG